MPLDLGTVTSAVVLKDAFSGIMDKVIEGVDAFEEAAKNAFPSASKFAEDMAPVFNVAALAVGATTAAIVGLVSATVTLAERGADVEDVAGTLEHFSGSSEAAAANLDALRSGVMGTMDDMTLMGEASKLLSAGVHLTSDEFGTLGQATTVLANRGNDSKQMLDLIGDAMISGKTKALAMKLGVIDLGDAQKNFADSLGIEVNQLSESGKAEAARVQVMKLLKGAVADAGAQEADFADKMAQARAAFQNWLDDLAVAVTQSPVLTTLVDELGSAFTDAFGDKQEDSIKTIVHWIEQGLIHTVDFAQGLIQAARVGDTVFSALETAAYAVATGIGAIITGLANAVVNITSFAANLPFATEGMKNAATMAAAFRDSIEESTIALGQQTAEAAKGILGQDEFNKKLDAAGGFLFNLKDKLVAAAEAEKDHKDAVDEHTAATGKGTEANKASAQSFIDQAKAEELAKKGLADATKLWDDYNKLVTASSGTSFDAQRVDIENWKADLIRQHKEAHTDTKEFYAAIEAVAGEKLDEIGSDWKNLADQSRESLQDQADAARRDYERMKDSGLHFSQEVLDKQLKKWMDLQDAAAGFGDKGKEAMDKTAEATKKVTDQVRTLSGELISLAEAEKRRSQGGSFEVTSQNFDKALTDITNPWWNPTGQGSNVDKVEAYRLAAQGYSFQEILDIFNRRKTGGSGPIPPPHGPRIPGFAGGGVVQVGENGPELVALPNGSQVFPHGTAPGGDTYLITMNVNGDGRQVAKDFQQVIMNRYRLRRKAGSA